ncbi:MAG: tetratricopeptide repeat protein, partial [Muribaculaceae bacterium]
MTIKEITNLRKSGHLQEALAAANIEFSKNSNMYTAGALFWCLYDLLKQQSNGDAQETLERMKALYNEFCKGDDCKQRSLDSAEIQLIPHHQEVKNAYEEAKNGGDAFALYQQVASWHDDGTLDNRLYNTFGWLIYYALKQTDLKDATKRKQLLFRYLKLELPRPSMLHSLILGEAVKVEENTPLLFRIRDFVRLWGLENLREEDWAQFKTEGGNVTHSNVEKLIKVYTKELRTDGVEAPSEFVALVDDALTRYPNNQYMPSYKADVLISLGRSREALEYYKNMILLSPSKFYLWDKMAELVEDVDLKIGLLSKALICGAEDKFLGAIRLKLATLLYGKNMGENAKYELDKYREIYQKNAWGLKSSFWELFNRLKSITSAANNDALYQQFAVGADEFIYSALPSKVAVKLFEKQDADRNRPGRMISTWILRTEKDVIKLRKPTKFRLNRHTPNGTVFDVKL